eukprot:gene139-4385_t
MGNSFYEITTSESLEDSMDEEKSMNISKEQNIKCFDDIYNTLEDVQKALIKSGLESSNLIIGIDYTRSNYQTGQKTFGGKNLHTIESGVTNPYQSCISIIGRTLSKLDEDNIIPVFGFGDKTTGADGVFSMLPDDSGRFCEGFEEVLEVYNKQTPNIELYGPTNFAPLIKAVEIVTSGKRREYHILVILTDGQVTDTRTNETKRAIIKASKYPLSIIVVGVGDGPWGEMEEYDDKLPQRDFDNFQFVDYFKTIRKSKTKDETDKDFALAALMEIPQQFQAIKKLRLL